MAKQLRGGTEVKVRTVSLYVEDWAEVEELARLKGLNRSSALRVIIREWRDACKVGEEVSGVAA